MPVCPVLFVVRPGGTAQAWRVEGELAGFPSPGPVVIRSVRAGSTRFLNRVGGRCVSAATSALWREGFFSPSSCRFWSCTGTRRSSFQRHRPWIPRRVKKVFSKEISRHRLRLRLQRRLQRHRHHRRHLRGGRIAAVERPTADPLVADTEPRDIIVESDFFRAVFANRGAELVSWQLKDYLADGRPVELIPRSLPSEEPWPFTLAFDNKDLTYLADSGTLSPKQPHRMRLGERTETLTFDYEDASGFSIHKAYTFDPSTSPFVLRLTVEARLGDEVLPTAIQWGPGLGGVEAGGSRFAFRQGPRGLLYGRVSEADGLLSSDPSVERPDRSDVAVKPVYDGLLDFVGVDNHYFAAVALPEQQQIAVNYRAVQLPSLTPDGETCDLMAFELRALNGVNDLAFFLGPKDFDILETASPPLVRAIDFGWLSVLVVPLHRSLKWVYGWVGNYGVAIILITLLVNIIIFPLRHKSVASMRKMQEIQPEMKAIQDRYAHLKATDPDKQKMNQEVMALYRDRGVNPVSGCLPMVLTMPILFAFYRLLSMAIELRGAPFAFWITDLSLHDPLYVTPIIMGASMVVQQRLTPSQADPMQQRIMMFMPVMFTFMFLWAPSGLVIYWLTSNLLGIGQQLVTYRIIGPPKVRTVRPPAERRVKAKKGGKKAAGQESETK